MVQAVDGGKARWIQLEGADRPDAESVGKAPSEEPEPDRRRTTVWDEARLRDTWESKRVNLAPTEAGLKPLWAHVPDIHGYLMGGDRRLYPPEASLRTLPPVKASGRSRDHEVPPHQKVDLIHVNGITTPAEKQFNDLQRLANALSQPQANGMQAEVRGIHNGTDGMLNDLVQATRDKLSRGRNPPLETLKNKILDRVRAREPVNLVVHSHGSILAARALREAKLALQMEFGKTKEEAESMMADTVRVLTAAPSSWNYPNGPRYLHLVNRMDAVTMGIGLGSAPDVPAETAGGRLLKGVGQALAHVSRGVRSLAGTGSGSTYHPGKDHHLVVFERDGGSISDAFVSNHSFRNAYLPEIEAARARLMGTPGKPGFFLPAGPMPEDKDPQA